MNVSVFDLFKIGIGPSSSHTVGPMIAACRFASHIEDANLLAFVRRVRVDLFGSLGATGKGHGTDKAVLLGLEGNLPDLIDPDAIEPRLREIRECKTLNLLGKHTIKFVEREHIGFFRKLMPGAPGSSVVHPNGMRFQAFDENGQLVVEKEYYSVGGGFVINSEGTRVNGVQSSGEIPHPFCTGDDLMRVCRETGLSIAEVTLRIASGARSARRPACNLARDGCLRGTRLQGVRRIARPHAREASCSRSLRAVAQALGRVVAGSALYARLGQPLRNGRERGERRRRSRGHRTHERRGRRDLRGAALLREVHAQLDRRGHCHVPADGGGHGIIYKETASISGAEVGCQGEVGVVLAAVMGSTPTQVENAAEIGMEHSLGMTCDPVGGLVQIPCIECNGRDQGAQRGGLAVNVIEC